MINYYFGISLYIVAPVLFIIMILLKFGITPEYIEYLIRVKKEQREKGITIEIYQGIEKEYDYVLPRLYRAREWKAARILRRIYKRRDYISLYYMLR